MVEDQCVNTSANTTWTTLPLQRFAWRTLAPQIIQSIQKEKTTPQKKKLLDHNEFCLKTYQCQDEKHQCKEHLWEK